SDRSAVQRVFLSAGKIHYDLKAAQQERKDSATAHVRLEQFYPFPAEGLARGIASYPSARELVWGPEEPQNMGGWSFGGDRLRAWLPSAMALRYAGRLPSASPATGNANVHKRELVALLESAFAPAAR